MNRKLKNFIRKNLGLPVYKNRVEINAVPIVDRKELLVPIIETLKLKINKDPHTPLRKSSFPAMTDHKLRKTVYDKLVEASEKLPEGYTLFVFESFRPYAVQLERFNFKVAKLREKFPHLPQTEIERRARMGVADPRSGAPHQTGGAVDVTILDTRNIPRPASPFGQALNMGTDWAEFNKRTPTKNWPYLLFARTVLASFTIMRNRDMLVRAMTSAGFVNYPGEWWHYSYGDRAWACYSGKSEAMYGSVEE